jgi:HAD superfamily hydrolase (TIGR01509 family)
MIGLRAPVAFQLMIDDQELDDTVESLRAESDEVFLEILPTRLRTMPGLLELLDALETAEMPRGIATSSPRAFADRVLGQFDLAPRFDFVLGAEDVHDGKPAPEIYQRAAQLAGVEPAAMLVLEDSAVGSRAGLAAGAYTIAVPQGHTAGQDFSGVHFIADTLADPRIFEVLGLADASD